MGILDWFRKPKLKAEKVSNWRELGSYNANFSAFGCDIYKSDIVRSCVRPLAEHTAKANCVSSNPKIAELLNNAPNYYMNGKDFLAKVRTRLELYNTAIIYILRDDKGAPIGFYPVPYSAFKALEYNNGLFIEFSFSSGMPKITLPWEDLAVLRKDYNTSDIAGDDNNAILGMLDLIATTNQGVANAVKSTANLRGILKSTKAILSPTDLKAQRDSFVNDYMALENAGGIASLDATQEFTPLTMQPQVTSWETIKEFRENVYRYYGISEAIITSDYTEAQMEAFYDSRIEPFLVALSLELTKKVFTQRERAWGAQITYESNRIQYSSNTTKLAMVALVDRGALTPNEWRAIFNLAPVEGGDIPLRRLDTTTVDAPADDSTEEENENADKE